MICSLCLYDVWVWAMSPVHMALYADPVVLQLPASPLIGLPNWGKVTQLGQGGNAKLGSIAPSTLDQVDRV